MRLKLNWTGDKAIGFATGVGVSLAFTIGLISFSPFPFVCGLLLLAFGVLVPSTETTRP